MIATRVARRYAGALFKLALEENSLEDVTRDMALIDAACRQSAELMAFIKNPVLSTEFKKSALDAVFAGALLPLTRRFLAFLMEKKRLSHLCEITGAFLGMDRARRGIASARMVTAMPLSPETAAQLSERLRKKFNRQFEIQTATNPDLIGGFTLSIQDRVYDCSIAHQIQLLRRHMLGDIA